MFQPLYVRPINASERENLERFSESANREESWRAQVILLSAEGRTAVEISQKLEFHPSNVKKWIRKFNKEGIKGIAVRKRGPQGGPRPNFSSEQVEAILDLSKVDPTTLGYSFKEWTPQKLATAAIERRVVERISHVTVRQLLKKSKVSQAASGNGFLSRAVASVSDLDFTSRGIRLQLGKEAFSAFLYDAAIEHLYAALEEVPGSGENEALARLLLSKALEELSRFNEAYEVIAKYEDSHVLSPLPPRTRARIKLRIGSVHSWLRNAPKAIASLNEAKKLFLEFQDDLGVSEAHCTLGRTYIRLDEFRIARDHLLFALNFQNTNSDRELLARIYDQLGTVSFSEGAFSSARENYLKALGLAEGSADMNLLGMILLNLGTTLDEGYLGEHEQSAKYIKRAIEHLKMGGRKDQLALAYNNLAANLRDAGEWDDAIVSVNKGIEIAQSFTEPGYEATARITLSEILSARGKYLEAEENLDRSLRLVEGSVDKWAESNALRILAGVYKGLGRIEEALRTLRNALSLSTSIGDLHGVTFAHIELAGLHFLQGGHEQAREYLELAQGRLKEEKSLFLSGLIQRLSGQLEASNGRFAEAKQHIAQSISIFTTIKVPYEIARSHFEMGLLLKMARDVKGSEMNLLQAREIFQKVGADADLELTMKSLSVMAMGEERVPSAVRVAPANDVLLMQRLIEASASRELLLQELASVIYEYFPATSVVICREEEDRMLTVLVSKGLHPEGAMRVVASLNPSILTTGRREDGSYIASIGSGFNNSLFLYLSASEPFDQSRLHPLLKQAELGLETCSLRNGARGPQAADFEHRVQTIIPGFICCSAPMFGVIEKIQKIRTSDVTVLITGESGTGKELVARAIHQESARARAIFLPFNCTATPKEIIDSQLFGHRRGAFTGATANYPGIIKAADGGTLFLDEIGDLSLEVQPKLMRFLQESEIQPLGETKPLRVDVRVLAATNSDLERAVEDGRFREDLFHRLNIIRIHTPPLRDRREEVPVLASHFLDHFSSRSGKQGISLTQEAVEALTDYDWPGNVRQLRNEIERVVAYASEPARISAYDLSPEVAHPRRQTGSTRLRSQTEREGVAREFGGMNGSFDYRREKVVSNGGGRMKLKEATARLERQLIEEALVRNRNNLSRTAIDLGLSRRGLRLKLAQLGVQRYEGF